jgi:quercetin dioxygenase-like cupin family protein
MKLHSAVLSSLVAVAAASVMFDGRVAAQYGEQVRVNRSPAQWDGERFQVRRITLAPRAQMTAENQDAVLVFLTADLDGRMPRDEAIWVPRGQRPLENVGSVPFQGISVALKDAPAGRPPVTPPEAVPGSEQADVRILIDNPQVIVLKARYKSNKLPGPLHFHPQDSLVVYLRGGYTWAPNPAWGPYSVSRGDIDLVPANTLHTFSNGGSDPIEFLVIIPR